MNVKKVLFACLIVGVLGTEVSYGTASACIGKSRSTGEIKMEGKYMLVSKALTTPRRGSDPAKIEMYPDEARFIVESMTASEGETPILKEGTEYEVVGSLGNLSAIHNGDFSLIGREPSDEEKTAIPMFLYGIADADVSDLYTDFKYEENIRIISDARRLLPVR